MASGEHGSRKGWSLDKSGIYYHDTMALGWQLRHLGQLRRLGQMLFVDRYPDHLRDRELPG